MPTLPAAAALLASASGLQGLAALAGQLGFAEPALPLDDLARQALGVDDAVAVRIAAGPGTLRALLLEWPPGSGLRERLTTLATRLTARAPQLLWVVMAAEHSGPWTAIASWVGDRQRPRVAALLVDRGRVVPSDAETLCALAAISGTDDLLLHARWVEVLGREAMTRRFFRALEQVVGGLAADDVGGQTARVRVSDAERQELALLCVSRLLFLSFLECKGWLDGDRAFLEHAFERCMRAGGEYHRKILDPLFFGTLNTPVRARARAARAFGRVPFLNGGLFARTPLEKRRRGLHFSDAALGAVHGDLLTRYRFTAREDSESWSEASVDPEMLGKAFESLMAARQRRSTGTFYTPQPLVERLTREALADALSRGAESGTMSREAVARALGGEPEGAVTAALLREQVLRLRVLDPACGSGAFLVHALEQMAGLLMRSGDARSPADVRRDLLTRCLFGVDINPTAVWLCELRLWLAVVTESEESDPLAVPPLPNLDRHIRIGDSLAGPVLADPPRSRDGTQLARLRRRYALSSGARKRSVERALERAERALARERTEAQLGRCLARRRELLVALRGRDLFGERRRASPADREQLARNRTAARDLRAQLQALALGQALPFSFGTHFPDAAARGGFDLVLGNPPWVRLHRIPAAARGELRARFEVFAHAGWERGAAIAGAGRGFAAQVDLAAMFLERSTRLLRPGGSLALLLPTKMWHALAAGGARRLIGRELHLAAVEDWSESPPAFDAVVYPAMLLARRSAGLRNASPEASPDAAEEPPVRVVLHRGSQPIVWTIPRDRLTLDEDPASPWLVIPAPVRAAFDRLRRAGAPLAESSLGRPTLGVKCGCNEAFLVELISEDGELASVRSGARSGLVELSLLRPALRGEQARPWNASTNGERLLWTHDASGTALPDLPPRAALWLARWRQRLADRSDARHHTRWWSLFRTASAEPRQARVVWSDFGRTPRACVLPAGDATVPLNSCYVLPCPDEEDALALAALLNSPLAAAWLHVLAEPARGGYHRYLAWTMALLPLPRDWPRARTVLAPVARRAMRGESVSPERLLDTALRAYRVRREDIAPLLAWAAR